MATFSDLGIHQEVLQAISNMGFEETTPIQEQTIPLALQGRDIIGQAQTGTGKTAAFGIPIIESIELQNENIQAIVITPTRELAVQVAEELNKIGQFRGIRTIPIYGGQDIVRQITALRTHPQVIVGTPGRLMDHMNRRTIRLSSIRIVVLDEADEMLNMGFIEDIETILKDIPEDRQTLLFSATIPRPIQSLASNFMKNPELIAIRTREMTVPNTVQQYMEVSERQKFDVLCRVLDTYSPEASIIFSRTKRRVDELAEALTKRGYAAEGIHGDLTQSKRDSVLRKFKEGSTEILVATDVAARGLDISGVTHVFNFDIPQDPEGYVHRIGRTGRAGKSGFAITFASPREIGQLRMIERLTNRRMERKPVPTMTEAIEGQQRLVVEKLLQVIEEGNFHSYKALAEELLDEQDSVALLSAALKMLTKEPNTTPVVLADEAPPQMKKRPPMDGRTARPWRGMRDRNFSGQRRGNR
ncbi:MAG TPA: DEAD/DEAH box helicase [Spirochaetia bacterium]|nr:DEAD/DEAH box helicase [Spirochaetia bacterium]